MTGLLDATSRSDLGTGLALIGVSFALFLVAKMVKDLLTPYGIDQEVMERRNPAAAISLVGYFLATLIVLVGALDGPSRGIVDDTLQVGGYGLLGIALLNVARWVNDRFVLSAFSNTVEIVRDQNPGTGIVELGSYLASGLVVAGGIHGEGGGPITALAFFACGQLALVLFARLYQWITPFDVHEEIARQNAAAGLSFAGTLIALGVILLNATWGPFVSWTHNLAAFALYALAGFVLLPLVRVAFDRIFLPGGSVDREISEAGNVGVGLLEMSVAIAFSVLFIVTIDLDWVLVWAGL